MLVSGYDHSKQSENLTISLFASNFQHMLKDYTETSRQLFPNYFIPCVRTALTFTSLCLILKCLELLQFLLLAAAFGSFGPALPPHTSSATTTSLTENTESRKLSLLYCGICSAISYPSTVPFHFPGVHWLYPIPGTDYPQPLQAFLLFWQGIASILTRSLLKVQR